MRLANARALALTTADICAGVVASQGFAHARGVHDSGGAAVIQTCCESGGGGLVKGLGLIKDEHAVARQGHASGIGAGVPELGVGEDQVVVGHYNVRGAGPGAGFLGPAVVHETAERAFTSVNAAREVGQDVRRGVHAEFGHVTGGRDVGPGADLGQPFTEQQVRGVGLFVQRQETEVVGAALEKGGGGRDTGHARRQRQIMGPKLVLERLG